jgi:hypothetical protein
VLVHRGARFSLSLFVVALLPAVSVVVLNGSQAAMATPKAAKCPATAKDEMAAVHAAAACRGRVEILADRNEKTQVFANANGSFTAQSAAVVQRVHDSTGHWVKPDPTLRRDAAGRIVPVATSLQLTFSGGGTGDAATIGKGKSKLGLRWPGALPAPKLSGANATYADVLPGVDLVLTAQTEGFAEMLVVKTPAAAADPTLAAVRFTTTASRLRLRQDATGALTAVDDSGATLFGSGTPVIWDSSKPADDGTVHSSRLVVPGRNRSAMPVQLVGDGLVVHPDLTMLRNKATKFPVYIDPALGKSAWTMINSTFTTQSYWSYDKQDCPAPYASIQCAKVGYTTESQAMIYRSLFSFGISGLLNKHIQDAKLSMDTVYSYTNTDYGTQVHVAGAISSSTTWSNNAPSWGGTVATANSHAYDRVRRRTEWGLTGAVETAAGGISGTLTLGLRAVSESDKNQWKKFDAGTALLTVTYNSYPNAPDNITIGGQPCVRGASRPYLRTLTPVLKARLTDPDGTVRLLKGTFYWWNSSSGTRTSSLSVTQGSIVSGQYANATIPAGKLTDGGIYVVQAIANDGIDHGQYSTTCEFQVDVTPPGPPSAVTSTDYPNDGQFHGGVGTPGSFVFKPPATVPSDFYGYAYTTDPGVSAAAATQVAATATDHTATISLSPIADQTYNLRVWARDKAGNYSAALTYTFSVRAGTGPDARWTFDGQDGTDDTQHGNALTVTGGSWTPGRGSYGNAFVGDGTSAYASTTGVIATKDPTTGSPITLHSNKSFTVAATVRLDSAAGSGQRVVVAQDGSHTSPFLLSYSVTDKKWRFAVAASDVDAPTTVAVLSNSTVATGVWTRLFATYDGTSHALKLYVNGTLQTATGTSVTFDATGAVTVGRGLAAATPTGFFPGAIDDVRVYGRAVLATEHEFALVGLPNPPVVTMPGGTSAYVGKTLSAVLSAGGDTAVTKIQYQVGVSGTVTTVTLPAAGGQTTVNVTSTAVSTPDLIVQGIDTTGNKSPIASTLLEFDEAPALTGRVVDAVSGAPITGATVTLSPGDLTLTTTSTGAYSFTGIAAGTFDVTASFGGVGCASQIATTEVDVDRAVTIDLNLAPESDPYGYTCTTAANTPWVSGTTPVTFTDTQGGYVADDPVTLPFAMPYYGQTFTKAWISNNGGVTFAQPAGAFLWHYDVSLPDKWAAPVAGLLPFFSDSNVGTKYGGGIYTGTVGTGASQKFVIEWRIADSSGPLFKYEVLLSPDGDVTFNYSGLTSDFSKGADSTIGITSPGGNYALQYLFDEADLVSGTAVTFNYPAAPNDLNLGTVSGTVSRDGVPVTDQDVTLDNLTATTDANGHYEFDYVEPGLYDAETRQNCDGFRQTVDIEGDTELDMPVGTYTDGFGYQCDLEPVDFIPGTTPLPSADSDVDFGFAFPFYGETYTTASVQGGGVYVRNTWDPAPDQVQTGGDIEFDAGGSDSDYSQAQMLTAAVGDAPNRQFVVEWRDVPFTGHPGIRLTWEMIFGEDGTVKMVFPDPPPPGTFDYPVRSWFYALGIGLISYSEDGNGFLKGQSLVFRPPAAS